MKEMLSKIDWTSFGLGFGAAGVLALLAGLAFYLWVGWVFSRING